MATNFTNTFTGKGTSVLLPKRDTSAQEGMSQMITKANELKYQAYKQNEAEYLKNSQIDPVFVLSDSARKYQMSLIENFNKKWGKRAQETNYNLSTQDKQDMLTDKNLIISEAQNQLAQMETLKQQKDIIDKDRGINYDSTAFLNAIQEEYMGKGNWNRSLNDFLKPKSIEDVWGTRKVTGVSAQEELDVNMPGRIRITSASKKEVAPRMVETIFGDDRVMKQMLFEWHDRTEDDKKIYLDSDKNGIVTDEERRVGDTLTKSLDNPMIAAYVDRHWGNLVDVKFVNKTGSAKKVTEPVKIGGASYKIPPGMQNPKMPKAFGSTKYNKEGKITETAKTYSPTSFHFGGNVTIGGIPTRGGFALNEVWTADELASGMISGIIRLYDPINKVFLIESTKTSESTGQKSTTLFEIPENNIDNFDNTPLEYIGNKMTIAEYKKFMEEGMPAKEKTTEGNKWDKYKVK